MTLEKLKKLFDIFEKAIDIRKVDCVIFPIVDNLITHLKSCTTNDAFAASILATEYYLLVHLLRQINTFGSLLFVNVSTSTMSQTCGS